MCLSLNHWSLWEHTHTQMHTHTHTWIHTSTHTPTHIHGTHSLSPSAPPAQTHAITHSSWKHTVWWLVSNEYGKYTGSSLGRGTTNACSSVSILILLFRSAGSKVTADSVWCISFIRVNKDAVVASQDEETDRHCLLKGQITRGWSTIDVEFIGMWKETHYRHVVLA